MGPAGVKFFEQEPVRKITINKEVAITDLDLIVVSPKTTSKLNGLCILFHF